MSPSPPAGVSSPVPFAASPPARVSSSRSVLLKSASPANSPPSSSPPLPLFDLPLFDPAVVAAGGPPPPNANPPAPPPCAVNAGGGTATPTLGFAPAVSGLGSAGKSVSSAGLNRVATSPTDRQSIALGLATDASTPAAPAVNDASCERPPSAGFELAHQPPGSLSGGATRTPVGARSVEGGLDRRDAEARGIGKDDGEGLARLTGRDGSGRVPGDIPGDGGRDVHATPRAGWGVVARAARPVSRRRRRLRSRPRT